MSLIDWADPDEMLGLLVDYVTDEAQSAHRDRTRSRVLHALSAELNELADRDLTNVERVAALREIRSLLPDEFTSDPVTSHVDDCIEELQRIAEQQP